MEIDLTSLKTICKEGMVDEKAHVRMHSFRLFSRKKPGVFLDIADRQANAVPGDQRVSLHRDQDATGTKCLGRTTRSEYNGTYDGAYPFRP